jgi:hypothetical protein
MIGFLGVGILKSTLEDNMEPIPDQRADAPSIRSEHISSTPAGRRYSELEKDALSSAAAETVFVALPFVIYSFFLGFHNKLGEILVMPEWSIVSIVVSGQALVRFGSRAIKLKTAVPPRVTLVSTLLLLCVIVNVVVLMLVLTEPVGALLGIVQIAMFSGSSIIFFVMAYGDSRYQQVAGKTELAPR